MEEKSTILILSAILLIGQIINQYLKLKNTVKNNRAHNRLSRKLKR
ncbi:MAG: hypothetical protein ACYCX4_17445 [Bacillota bacterium]